MPCACLHSHLTCVLTGDLLIYVGWWRNSFNGGTWLGPRVIMAMAWSGIGLQARVIPACCTGGPHCNEYTTTTAVARLAEVQQQAVSRFWELLQDFVVLRAAPGSWLPHIAPDHPFLRVNGDSLGVHRVAVAPGAG
jgi:hypothetical protein